MNRAPSTRAALGDETTHVLHFGHYCGASDQNLKTDIGLLARGEQHKACSREKSVAHELPMITWRGRIES